MQNYYQIKLVGKWWQFCVSFSGAHIFSGPLWPHCWQFEDVTGIAEYILIRDCFSQASENNLWTAKILQSKGITQILLSVYN